MIKGVGTDIIEIQRIVKVLKKHGEAFLKKMLNTSEIEYCQRHQDAHPYIAARFAAKEAVVKALGIGFGEEAGFLDITIVHDELGKPIVVLSEKLREWVGDAQLHISLSHCKKYAVAFVVHTHTI